MPTTTTVRSRSFILSMRVGLLLITVACACVTAAAQNRFFEYPLNNTGREFYAAFPAAQKADSPWSLRSIHLYISSDVQTDVRIYAGGELQGTVTTTPNYVSTFELSTADAQMFEFDGIRGEVPADSLYPNKAVKILADHPVTVHSDEGMLLLPLSGLGLEYVVASGASNDSAYFSPSQFMVVAPFDGTTVTITYPDDSPNHQEGEEVTIMMNEGDVYSAMTDKVLGDMTGAHIRANNPIVVTAGHNCAAVPVEESRDCAHLSEMLIPVDAWGRAYHAVPYRGRLKGDTYRVFAGEPNATIHVNGEELATLSEVGGKRGLGWLEYREDEKRALDFTSDKKICVVHYRNGADYEGSSHGPPACMVLTPVEGYQHDFMFSTPGVGADEYFVSIVGDSTALADAEIKRSIDGEWEPVAAQKEAQTVSFPGSIHGKRYMGVSFMIFSGQYRIRSSAPIAGSLYSRPAGGSYAYPLSMAILSVSPGETPVPDQDPPTIEGDINCVGILNGTLKDWPNDQAVRTNLNSLELREATENFELSRPRIRSGVDRSIEFTLTAIDPLKEATAILVASDNAGNIIVDTVRYAPKHVELSSNTIAMSGEEVGQDLEAAVTVLNPGAETITVAELQLKYGDRGFTVVEPSEGFLLAPGESRTVVIRFRPESMGDFSDTLAVVPECGPTLHAVVTATIGGGKLAGISATDYSFGALKVGAATDARIRITSVGTGPLAITGISGPTRSVFTFPEGAPTLPKFLNPGESLTLKVMFSPTEVRNYIDSIVVEHNASGTSMVDGTVYLQGQGVLVGAVDEFGSEADTWMRLQHPGSSDSQLEIIYHIPERLEVEIALYSVDGRLVGRAGGDVLEGGEHHDRIDIRALPSGAYYVVLRTGDVALTKAVTIRR